MSLLWPNELLVSLSVNQVTVIYRSGITKRLLAQKTVDITESTTATWVDVMVRLDKVIAELKVSRYTRIHCTLASDFVRYIVLPPQQVRMTGAEKLAYANAGFLEIYGYAVNDWAIEYDYTPPNQPTLVAAIDQLFVDEMMRYCKKHHFHLTSLQPYLMSAFNRLNSQIQSTTAILAIIEQNRLLMLRLQAGVYQQIKSYKIQGDWQVTLNEILLRERVLSEHQYHEVLIYAPTQKSTTFNNLNGWQIKKIGLQVKPTSTNAAFAMLEVLV